MDQELLTYLKEQFHEIRQRSERVEEQLGGLRGEVGGLREETRERFEKVDERFKKVEGQISGLREESRERFEKVEGQISGLREESQEGIRHTHILIEDVRGIVRLLAEGMAGLDERMGRLEVDLNRKLKELWDMVVTPVRSLGERVTHLEEVENRRARDIVDVIRERYGLPRES